MIVPKIEKKNEEYYYDEKLKKHVYVLLIS